MNYQSKPNTWVCVLTVRRGIVRANWVTVIPWNCRLKVIPRVLEQYEKRYEWVDCLEEQGLPNN